MVEELLQTLVGVVDAQLFECVVLTTNIVISIVTSAVIIIIINYFNVLSKADK